jgi:hypothetical protein
MTSKETTMPNTTITTPDLAALDAEIEQAQRDLDAAQNRYRNRPRGAPRMGGGAAPIRIDPQARAHMLDLGLEVDDAAIRLEQLKKQRAEGVLAELTDRQAMAAEDAAAEAARKEMEQAEAVATQARMAFARANGARKDREARVKVYRAELARAEPAIRSAQSLREKEQAERLALAVL